MIRTKYLDLCFTLDFTFIWVLKQSIVLIGGSLSIDGTIYSRESLHVVYPTICLLHMECSTGAKKTRGGDYNNFYFTLHRVLFELYTTQ